MPFGAKVIIVNIVNIKRAIHQAEWEQCDTTISLKNKVIKLLYFTWLLVKQ